MSHFTVMVIGDDVAAALAPFHEFECTGENDKYVQDVDVTEELNVKEGATMEEIVDALGSYGLEESIVDDESKVDTVGDKCKHKYGYAIVKDGVLIKAVNRTNPNRKWDWYQVGGRWSGFLQVKPGAAGEMGQRSWMNRGQPTDPNTCDSALKKDIDFEGMRSKAGDEAAKRWDEAHAIIKGRTWITWQEAQGLVFAPLEGQDVWEQRRAFYNAQAALIDLRKDFSNPFLDLDEYLTPREKFIQDARNGAISTFAVLKDGVWYERGDMGWWGMVSDEKDKSEWVNQIASLLDELSDDTRISIVDCHI